MSSKVQGLHVKMRLLTSVFIIKEHYNTIEDKTIVQVTSCLTLSDAAWASVRTIHHIQVREIEQQEPPHQLKIEVEHMKSTQSLQKWSFRNKQEPPYDLTRTKVVDIMLPHQSNKSFHNAQYKSR